MIKEVYTHSTGEKYTYDYTYDGNNNLIKEVYTAIYDGNYNYVYDYTYDDNNNLIKKIHTVPTGKKFIDDYIYDVNGNLVKEVYTSFDENKNQIETQYKLIYMPFTHLLDKINEIYPNTEDIV